MFRVVVLSSPCDPRADMWALTCAQLPAPHPSAVRISPASSRPCDAADTTGPTLRLPRLPRRCDAAGRHRADTTPLPAPCAPPFPLLFTAGQTLLCCPHRPIPRRRRAQRGRGRGGRRPAAAPSSLGAASSTAPHPHFDACAAPPPGLRPWRAVADFFAKYTRPPVPTVRAPPLPRTSPPLR